LGEGEVKMKTFIYIFGIVFCLVGCGKTELPSNITEDHGGDENPVRELTSEEKKIVGTYDPIGGSSRLIFQENGMVVYTVWDKKKEEVKWEIQNGELVVFWEESFGVGTTIYRPEANGDITVIAYLDRNQDEKRVEYSEKDQKFMTHKKLQ